MLLGGEDEEENVDDDEEEVRAPKRKITVVAHNFQGYDSYFVIQEYHRQARILTQIRMVLELKVGKKDHERLRFIDSMFSYPCPWPVSPVRLGSTKTMRP